MLQKCDVYVGIDVGKSFHHAIGLLAGNAERIFSRRVAQSEGDIRNLIGDASEFGTVHVTVDQMSDVGGLVVATAKDCGTDVGYLPTYTMRQAARLYPGYAKTDAIDAAVIADVSLRMPELAIPVDDNAEKADELSILASQHVFLVKEATRVQLRMRGMLARINPQIERVFPRERLFGKLALELFERYGGPEGFKSASRARVRKWASNKPRQCSRAPVMVDDIFDAIDGQAVSIPGSKAMEGCISADVSILRKLQAAARDVDARIGAPLDGFPEARMLRSMPGIGDIWCATVIGAVGGFDGFPTPAHLTSYAGLAPGKWDIRHIHQGNGQAPRA